MNKVNTINILYSDSVRDSACSSLWLSICDFIGIPVRNSVRHSVSDSVET